MRLLIFGAGGMGRELADIAARQGGTDIAFVADEGNDEQLGHPFLRPDEIRPDDRVVLAIGNSAARRQLAKRFAGQGFGSVISDQAILSPSAKLGGGAMVCDFVLVNNRVEIGSHVQLNCFSQVSHDCVLGDFVTFAPRVTCNGWVNIGDGVFVGAGATIRNGSSERRLQIGEGAVIGMGAVVVDDVLAGATVIGNPARPLR